MLFRDKVTKYLTRQIERNKGKLKSRFVSKYFLRVRPTYIEKGYQFKIYFKQDSFLDVVLVFRLCL